MSPLATSIYPCNQLPTSAADIQKRKHCQVFQQAVKLELVLYDYVIGCCGLLMQPLRLMAPRHVSKLEVCIDIDGD